MRFPLLGKAFTAHNELLVFAPILTKLETLVESLGVTVGFAGEAGLFQGIPCGDGVRLLDTGGEPRGDGFGGDGLRGFCGRYGL